MTGRQIVIDGTTAATEPAPVNPLARLMPVVMIAAMAGMTVLYLTSTQGTTRNPMFLFFPAMMLVSLIGSLVHGATGPGPRW